MRVIQYLIPFLASLSSLPVLSAQDIQSPLRPDDNHPSSHLPAPLRIAIIGAGAAGSSAAYHISLFANASNSPSPSITIFDPNPHAGGRSTTVDALNNNSYPVELGASIFVKINHILYNTSQQFDLVIRNAARDPEKSTGSGIGLGVWDGEEFVFTQASDGDKGDGEKGWRDWKGWWDIAKLLWRYGLAPIRTQRMMKDSTGRFLRFYEAPIFPFYSLDQAVYETELEDYTGVTGTEILNNGGVGEKFQREIIQASTRVNYGQNLAGIHGLEALVCMAIDGAMSIEGGNWQIFQKMVEASGAAFMANTTVTEISKAEDGSYQLTTHTKYPNSEDSTTSTASFNTIILASPLQFSNLAITPPLAHTPSPIPYVCLHVTLLTSPRRISPTYFHLESQDLVPDTILTTLPSTQHPLPPSARGPLAVGPAGFWSISLLRTIPPTTSHPMPQFLYKVFSPAPLTGTWLSSLLDFEYSNTSTSDPLAELLGANNRDVTWLHEKAWNSYPYETPRRDFERLRLDTENGRVAGHAARGSIWYTSGIESFISTMETSALMGMNVARLVVDEMILE